MTLEELNYFDGREGRKAYVAVSGKVYDLTESPMWQEGNHQQMHQAGCDLTEELQGAPHIRSVVDRFPVVGSLEMPEPAKAGGGGKWLAIAAIILAALVAYLAL